MNTPDILNIQRGAITAPAGCGKTHLIADALVRHSAEKPILVLTHTNAGVAALRKRLDNFGVDRKRYKLSTIDGWCMRLVGTFPTRSKIAPENLALTNANRDYPAIKQAAIRLLGERAVDDLIRASYTQLLVDEYQDCSEDQHAIIVLLSELLPTCIFGDPMQAIFGWGRNIPPDWYKTVLGHFPLVGELDTPWRWKNAKTEPFGRWLLDVRKQLESGQPIDLRNAPPEVTWVHLDGTENIERQIRAGRTKSPIDGGTVLIIAAGNNKPGQRNFAARIGGASVVENADLGEFVDFARNFDLEADDAVFKLIAFCGEIMSGVGAREMVKRVQSLRAGRARNPATVAEQVAIDFSERPSSRSALQVIEAIGRQPGVYPHRSSIVRALIQALNACSEGVDLHESAIRVREQSRVLGRKVPGRAVGSTLLLKGLEAEVCVILETDALKSKDLYVAMTRGSRKLVVCSSDFVLNPAPQ